MIYILSLCAISLSLFLNQYFFLVYFTLALLLAKKRRNALFITLSLAIASGFLSDIFWVLPQGTAVLLYGAFVVLYELYGMRYNVQSPLFLFVFTSLYSMGFVSLLQINVTRTTGFVFIATYAISAIYLHRSQMKNIGLIE